MTKLLVPILLLFASSAQAEFLLEPFVGYATGSVKSKYNVTAAPAPFVVGAVDDKDSTGGSAYGARLGWGMAGFTVGGEYSIRKFKDDLNPVSTAAFAAYQTPMSFRFWVSYILNSHIKVEEGKYTYKYSGSGLSFGAGYLISPWMSLNAEMAMLKFNELTSDIPGLTVEDVDIAVSAYMLSLSFPLSF